MQRLLRATAIIFLVLTPIAFIAYYMGQRSIIDEGLDYFAPDFSAAVASPAQRAALRCGPTFYVPAYSHVFWADGRGALLSVTLSIRNTSPERPVLLKAVDYYDTAGALLSQEIGQPVILRPLQTATLLVTESDARGGVGANFIVRSGVEGDDTPLLIEAVMVGRTPSGNISFSRPALVIGEECA